MRQSSPTHLSIATADDMRALGQAMARALCRAGQDSFVIGIEGELGAGKTTLVGGVLRAMGVTGAVRSPTYTLVEPYEARGRLLYHLDLYRLADPGEVEALGVRDLLTPAAVLLIEWPSRGGRLLPPLDLGITIQYESSVPAPQAESQAESQAQTEADSSAETAGNADGFVSPPGRGVASAQASVSALSDEARSVIFQANSVCGARLLEQILAEKPELRRVSL